MKEFKYKINGSPYRVVVSKYDNENVELEVNGTPFTVEIEPKAKKVKTVVQRHNTPNQAQDSGNKGAASTLVVRPSTPSSRKNIKSPLPGIILDIRCKIGDTVKKGQTIMILEAMKMENNIIADNSGKIVEILVQKGDSVLEGANLVVVE